MKILLIAAALVAASTSGSATEVALPNAMLGGWCYQKALKAYTRGKCVDAFFIQIKPTYMKEGVNLKCEFKEIAKIGKNAYKVESTCHTGAEEDMDDGESYQDSQVYRLSGRKLTITSTWGEHRFAEASLSTQNVADR
jgi:hypothetical protein